jgi:hypothetical protein
MKFDPIHCPECGELANGTLEQVHGRWYLSEPDPATGHLAYTGEDEVFWEEIRTVERDGKPVLLCPNGHDWPAAQIDEQV